MHIGVFSAGGIYHLFRLIFDADERTWFNFYPPLAEV